MKKQMSTDTDKWISTEKSDTQNYEVNSLKHEDTTHIILFIDIILKTTVKYNTFAK